MKKIIYLFVLTLLGQTLYAQGFVEEFRSESNRRPPRGLINDGSQYAIRDMNQNGSPDFTTLQGTTFRLRDGETHEVIESWQADDDSQVHLGFFNFDTDYYYAPKWFQLTELGEIIPVLRIFNVSTGEIMWEMQNATFLGVDDYDHGGVLEVMVFDRTNRQTVIVGLNGADTRSNVDPTVPIHPAQGGEYELQLKFESEPNRRLISNLWVEDVEHLFDANGDGQPEIVLFIEDDDKNPIGMIIRNGFTHNIMWQFAFPDDHLDELQGEFHGFFDANGDDEMELLFGKRTVVTLDKEIHEIDPGFEIKKVYDIDNDGYADLLGRGLADSTLQIWGTDSSTSITEAGLAEMGIHIYPSYPNPFKRETTISFELNQSADVNLQIFNVQGVPISTLVETELPSGKHNYRWDGQDKSGVHVPVGMYMYRLSVNGRQQTQKLLYLGK